MEITVKDDSTVKIPTPDIEHNGKVRMGSYSPLFPPVRAQPATVDDNGTPAFPPARPR